METRGYGSGPRTYLKEPGMGVQDYLAVFLVAALLLRLQGPGGN